MTSKRNQRQEPHHGVRRMRSKCSGGGGELERTARAAYFVDQHHKEAYHQRDCAERSSHVPIRPTHIGSDVLDHSVQHAGTDATEESDRKRQQGENRRKQHDAQCDSQHQLDFGLLLQIRSSLLRSGVFHPVEPHHTDHEQDEKRSDRRADSVGPHERGWVDHHR
jgi:hypothetical protein